RRQWARFSTAEAFARHLPAPCRTCTVGMKRARGEGPSNGEHGDGRACVNSTECRWVPSVAFRQVAGKMPVPTCGRSRAKPEYGSESKNPSARPKRARTAHTRPGRLNRL